MGLGQTSYGMEMGRFSIGTIANNSDYLACSFVCDTAMGFGLGVVAGALTDAMTPTGGSVKLPSAQGDVFRGITLKKAKERAYPYSSVDPTYAAMDVADIVRKGSVWVVTDGSVCTLDTTVYVTTEGKFTSTAGTNTTVTTGVFRRIESTTAAMLEINMP